MAEFLTFRDMTRHLSPPKKQMLLRAMGQSDAEAVDLDWNNWAHGGQKCPAGDWRTWVLKAGRGYGKTRTGAEWVAACARNNGKLKIALVAATLAEARSIMVDGEAGLLAIAGDEVARWMPSRGYLRFTSGAEAALFSGASPEQLRGPQHHIAWCDELAKWEKPGDTWDMLQLGMRLGERPQVLVTTTPRPGPTLTRIMAAKGCVVTGGRTRENPHLPAVFVETVEALYAGTRLGRQELDGELLPDVAGALWSIELLERCRMHNSVRPEPVEGLPFLLAVQKGQSFDRLSPNGGGNSVSPSFTRTVIGVDPPAGDGTCGIIACAIDADGVGYVLADHSVTACSPERWARAVAAAAEVHGAQLVVAETNQGGTMVEAMLRAADIKLRVRSVTASMSKSARAVPIATAFEAGKVRLCGRFEQLEAELCGMIAGGGYEGPGRSPDRANAMVWALTELMLGKEKAMPRISVL